MSACSSDFFLTWGITSHRVQGAVRNPCQPLCHLDASCYSHCLTTFALLYLPHRVALNQLLGGIGTQ